MVKNINRTNLGRMILAARAMHNMTRVDLAKLAGLAHPTVKLAEDGDEAASEEALAKICRALEQIRFEFVDGTCTATLAYHPPGETDMPGLTADASMPGSVRLIYPRRLDPRGLVRDLDACGVEIENAERLIDLCATSNHDSWHQAFINLVREGRKLGIRFSWRDGVENADGVRHVVRVHDESEAIIEALLQNIATRPPGASAQV